MKKIIVFVTILFILVACTSGGEGSLNIKDNFHSIKQWLKDGIMVHWTIPLQQYEVKKDDVRTRKHQYIPGH